MPHKDQGNCCERPERLNGRPEDCTPEQIRECHGESGEHECCCEKEAEKA